MQLLRAISESQEVLTSDFETHNNKCYDDVVLRGAGIDNGVPAIGDKNEYCSKVKQSMSQTTFLIAGIQSVDRDLAPWCTGMYTR